MAAIAVPILPGKLDAWKAWGDELNGPRRAELEDLNARHGLRRHRAFLQQNPDGSHLVIAIHDGPGGDGFLAALAGSDHPFDRWFVEHVADLHGVPLSMAPPAPELVLDAAAARGSMAGTAA
jgi:hypothetical protein